MPDMGNNMLGISVTDANAHTTQLRTAGMKT